MTVEPEPRKSLSWGAYMKDTAKIVAVSLSDAEKIF
jgi:hypothetical protein